MRIVVTGYASLDYAMRLDAAPQADRTATILSRSPTWPRLGGSPAYVAAGAPGAIPVSWVGDDAEGARYCEDLRQLGVATQGVRTRPGRTPVCMLVYQPDGGCFCLYDPGLAAPIALDDTQRGLIAGAGALCVTVGPPDATGEALRLARPDAKVIWVVKADPKATPPDLAAALAARADIVVYNRAEAPFVAAAYAAAAARTPLRLETRGREGVAIVGEAFIPAEVFAADDTTGAGDTFVGGFLAAYLTNGATSRAAVRYGMESVRKLLASRVAAVGG